MLPLNRAHQKENKNLIPFTIGTISCKKNIERKNIKETRRYLVVPLIGISVWKLFYVPTYTGNTRNIDVIPVGVYVCLLVYCFIFFLFKVQYLPSKPYLFTRHSCTIQLLSARFIAALITFRESRNEHF